ncbi:MAG TPA: aminopeptidase [Thermodesulfobacteriota bacterium]|nr:aminopeptidase [Thermodesulfobacteriota bacterium]
MLKQVQHRLTKSFPRKEKTMADPRIKKLAWILVNHSLRVKKGETVLINSSSELAKPLVLEVFREVVEAGGNPALSVSFEETQNIFYENAGREQLRNFPKTKFYEAKNTDCFVHIRAPLNKKALSNIDPKKISERSKVVKAISDTIVNKKRWILCNFPTNALAQEAEMSIAEYEDFLYGATNVDWEKVKKEEAKLKRALDAGNEVRIVGEDTDMKISIKGRKAIACWGERNMPDGEVFLSPVEDSAEGYIYYEMPAIYQGREVTGIRLRFRGGKVVAANADKNENFLISMLDTDRGGRFLGELGVGVNYGIKKFSKDILFDEKIGGTVHLAVGRSYEEAGGKNKSAIHWDMIKDLRKNGALYIDGKIIQKNGRFLI